MRILVADDDETLRLTVRASLEIEGHEAFEAEDGQAAIDMVVASSSQPFEAILLDVNMPRKSGLQALEEIRRISPGSLCIMLTAFTDYKDAVNAIKLGAYDYLEKPVDSSHLKKVMECAKEANHLVEQMAFSAPQLQYAEGRQIVGGSTEIKKVFDVVAKLAPVDTAVLIRGESGTGKELVGRAIHYNSPRKKGPFVAVNCAAIPENLIESELFGHDKGSFTGADKKKLGKFQFAEGGTLFLDEIGDISQSMQVKLLRVLQEKVFTPLGTNLEVKADVRIISATNKPLEKMMASEDFRSDLFYRLSVLPIHLPPLRNRREDIYSLSKFLMKKFNRLHNRNMLDLHKDALNALKVYSWPGNIRELENVIEHCFILEAGSKISFDSLPEYVKKSDAPEQRVPGQQNSEGLFPEFATLNYPQMKEQFEKEFLTRALKTFQGKINQTAEHTKMTKVTLLRKLEKYGIDPKAYYPSP